MNFFKQACQGVNGQVHKLLNKNHVAAVRNRLKLNMASEQRAMENALVALGRACYDRGLLSQDEEMEKYYDRIRAAKERMEKIGKKLDLLDHPEQEPACDNIINIPVWANEAPEGQEGAEDEDTATSAPEGEAPEGPGGQD